MHVGRPAAVLVAAGVMLGVPGAAHADTYTVASTADVPQAVTGTSCATSPASAASGACTLRAAVQAAGNATTDSTIVVPAGTYVLTQAPPPLNAPTFDGTSGGLIVRGNTHIAITGAGASSTIIDGGGLDRVFAVVANTNATISGVTIQGGRSEGIGNVPALTCPEVYAGDDPFSGAGGGIVQIGGTLTLNDDVVRDNVAMAAGGGIGDLLGSLNLHRTTVADNIACPGHYSGAAASASGYTGPIPGVGGGIAVVGQDEFASQSTAIASAAEVVRRWLSSPPLPAPAPLQGAAPAARNTYIDSSTISGNVAAGAGGAGGGIESLFDAAQPWLLVNSTVTGNTAGFDGGGIENEGTTPLLLADTIASNTAQGAGETRFLPGLSGPTSCPQPACGGNLSTNQYSFGFAPEPPTTAIALADTIVSGGRGADTGGGGLVASNCDGGPFRSLGSNLDDIATSAMVDTCGLSLLSADVVGRDPKLGPLSDNGGPTLTMALPATGGSPAIDGVWPGLCKVPSAAGAGIGAPSLSTDGSVTVDQRGVARPQGPLCDIGAFELVPARPGPAPAAPPAGGGGGVLGTGTTSTRCVSRRHFTVHIQNVRSLHIVRAKLFLNGRLNRTLTGPPLQAPVDLRNLPYGTFTLQITAWQADGHVIHYRRTYHTCRQLPLPGHRHLLLGGRGGRRHHR